MDTFVKGVNEMWKMPAKEWIRHSDQPQAFFVSQLQKRLPSGMMAIQTDLLLCVAYGLSTDKLTFDLFF